MPIGSEIEDARIGKARAAHEFVDKCSRQSIESKDFIRAPARDVQVSVRPEHDPVWEVQPAPLCESADKLASRVVFQDFVRAPARDKEIPVRSLYNSVRELETAPAFGDEIVEVMARYGIEA